MNPLFSIAPVLDTAFTQVKPHATSDSKGRITLGKNIQGKGYRIYRNSAGQILLDPVVELSQHELQILSDPEKRKEWADVIRDVETGHLEDRGSFSDLVD